MDDLERAAELLPAIALAYVLLRSAAHGFTSGLVTRLPAKAATVGGMALVFAWADGRSHRFALSHCERSTFVLTHVTVVALPAFVVMMFVARVLNAEAWFGWLTRRDSWPAAARWVDGVLAIPLEVAATVFLLQLFASFFENTTAAPLLHDMTAAIGRLPKAVQDGPLWSDTQSSLLHRYGEPCGFSSHAPDSAYGPVAFGMMFLIPVAIWLSFETLFLRGQGHSEREYGGCRHCRGTGKVDWRQPLLVGTMCGHCLGTGNQRQEGDRVPIDPFEIGEGDRLSLVGSLLWNAVTKAPLMLLIWPFVIFLLAHTH
jgi:hypothetical protein